MWRVRLKTNDPLTTHSTLIEEVTHHPLSQRKIVEESDLSSKISTSKKVEFEDPLGALIENPLLDLDQVSDISNVKDRSHSLDNTLETKRIETVNFDLILPDFTSWQEKRNEIVNYTRHRDETMTEVEKLKLKIQMLEGVKVSSPKDNVSSNFVKKINELRANLNAAWATNQRVESFNIAAEVSKLIATPVSLADYPYHWVLATEVLDNFRLMVYERIHARANEERKRLGQSPLNESFHSDDVPPQAKDVVKHWFLKLSDLKEVVTRFYVETALIGCLKFLDTSALRINLERLASMCSKFPQDVTAAYARAYICRVSVYLDPPNRCPSWRVTHDWLQASNVTEQILKTPNMHDLCAPAIEWTLGCVAYGAHTMDDLAPLWEYCRHPDKYACLAPAFVKSVSSKYLSMYAKEMMEMILANNDNHKALKWLARRLLASPPPEEVRDFLKTSAWTRIGCMKNFYNMITCCSEWTKFTARFFPASEITRVVDFVFRKLDLTLGIVQLEEKHFSRLVEVVSAAVDLKSHTEIEYVVKNSKLTNILSILMEDKPSARKAAENMLSSIVKVYERGSIKDAEVSYFVFSQCNLLCQDDYSQTYENKEKERIDKLIVTVLTLPTIKSDLQAGLEMIQSLRSQMGHKQAVVIQILAILIDYTFYCYRTMKDGSKKSEYMRVCITNIVVTIPAVHDDITRLFVSIQAVQLCLMVNFLPQLDASMRRCLDILHVVVDTKNTTAVRLEPVVKHLLAVLQHVPDSTTESEMMFYYSEMMSALDKRWEEWVRDDKQRRAVTSMWMECVKYLVVCRTAQPMSVYKFVTPNSVLYNGDDQYREFLDDGIEGMMERLLALSEDPWVAMVILENLVSLFEVDPQNRKYVRGLLKTVQSEPKMSKRVRAVIQDLQKLSSTNEEIVKILQKLKLN